MRWPWRLGCVCLVGASCAVHRGRAPLVSPVGTAPIELLGAFQDDYGINYRIDADAWHQGERTTYHVRTWHANERYLIARNASSNPSGADRWTRIDWMPLPGMAPYEWAYCLSAYEARTPAAAEATEVARRDAPRTGCNGFPFSRMKRIDARPR